MFYIAAYIFIELIPSSPYYYASRSEEEKIRVPPKDIITMLGVTGSIVDTLRVFEVLAGIDKEVRMDAFFLILILWVL